MAASSMPIPLPPRTPTPPPDDDEQPHRHHQHETDADESADNVDFDFAFSNSAYKRHSLASFDPRSLSPAPLYMNPAAAASAASFTMGASIDRRRSPSPSPPLGAPPPRSLSPASAAAASSNLNPFNFQPAMLAKSPVKSVSMVLTVSGIGQRRGHKYKHSSVSHQIFLEPPPRAPLALPNSLPIPTLAECRASMTTDQKVRFYWSICHMLMAGYTASRGGRSASIQALSHLIFYDGLGALLCVLVEVFGNFEVWGRSSLVHPFGLQRMEVIAGFALSILLIFFGFDLISHNAKHALEGIGHHAPHHPHSHAPVSPGSIELTAVLAIGSTLVSAVALKNHARIAKAMRFAAMKNLPSVLSNPSHFLTLSCSATLLVLPLISLEAFRSVDTLLSLSIALAMLFLGVHLAINVGSMLLMSYPSKDVRSVIVDIASDPLVRSVDQAKFWQAHYGLGIANLKLRVQASQESGLTKLRERITSLVRNRLSGGYGSGGQRWEVSVQFELDLDHGHSHSHSHNQDQAHPAHNHAHNDGNVQVHDHGHGHGHGHSHSHGNNHLTHFHTH